MNVLKKIKSIGIVLIAMGLLFFSSCTNQSPENLKVIPKETSAVSVFDIYSIARKGKLDKIDEMNFFRTFKKEIRSENKRVSKIIENVIEDPSISGLNLLTDVFGYYVSAAKDEKFLCLSAEIKDQDKFAEFIEDILDKSEIEFDIENEKTYSYTLIGKESAIAWDEDKAILLIAENYTSRENLDFEIETLMGLPEKDQITANEKFAKFYNNKKDVSFWFSTNYFTDSYGFKRLQKEVGFDITGNYISSYLNFGDNDISLRTQFEPNDEIKKMMDKNNVWDNKFNSQLLNYFPKQNYVVSSISLNPMSYYNLLEEEGYEDFQRVQTQFNRETELELKEFFKAIKGSALYSLFGFDDVEYTYMKWGYSFDENKAELLDKKYKISEAGYLSLEDKEQLNLGKTIKTESYSGRYSINIKNIIDNGGTVETAIANNSEINWYKGGWSYGKNVETTTKDFLPLMGLVIDINGNQTIKKMIEKIPEDVITKQDDYYEFKFGNRYPTYLAYNEDVCFVTNDKKRIKAFVDGEDSADNLSDASISSDILGSKFYTFLNLNYDDYPKELKKKVQTQENDKQKRMIKIWNDFAKSIELKQVNENSFEIIFNTKDNDNNSLNTIITAIDDNYKYFM